MSQREILRFAQDDREGFCHPSLRSGSVVRIRPADLTHVGLPTSGDSPEEQNEIRDASERVVVVAARFALDENRKCSAYICQAHRSFRRCVRMTFYTKNKFDRRISKILGQYASTYQMELDDP